MKKKGQAAMEFLMTYGWAILAAIIVIGVIAIYFRPSTLVTESAIVSPPFYAVASDVAQDAIQLELKNNGGESLKICSITVGTCTIAGDADCDVDGTETLYDTVAAGDKIEQAADDEVIDFVDCTIAAGESVSKDVTITYKRTGSDIVLTSAGTVSGKA